MTPDGRSIDPRIRLRRLSIQRSRDRRRLRWLIGVGAVVVVAAGALLLLQTPLFAARVVTVRGSHPHTSDAAIVAASGLSHHPALIGVSAGSVAARVERLPFIASARVRRTWPDGVLITVTERAPALQMAGPGASWSVLDDHGRTLQTAAVHVPGLRSLVVRTSTQVVDPPPVGGTVPPGAAGGLLVARTLPPAFAGQVTAVTVDADGTVSLVLVSGITVLLGAPLDLVAKYEDVASILAHGALHPSSVIDVSVPQSPTVGR